MQKYQLPIHNGTLALNQYLINNVEDIVVFLGFQNYNHWYLIHIWLDKALRVTLWIGHCNLCMQGHLKLRLQSLKRKFICIIYISYNFIYLYCRELHSYDRWRYLNCQTFILLIQNKFDDLFTISTPIAMYKGFKAGKAQRYIAKQTLTLYNLAPPTFLSQQN